MNVLTYFSAYPQASIRSARNDLGLSYYLNKKIFVNHKTHQVQALKSQDYHRMVELCENIFIHINEDADFLKKLF